MSAHTRTSIKAPATSKSTFTPVPSGLLQRKCACGGTPGMDGECEECRQKRLSLQRRATNQAEPATVPSIVHDVLRSPGQPLDAQTRAFMEPRFGHNFSQVRVHTDGRAAESAKAVNALAYTVGRDVVFGAGQYALRTMEGRRLLAHELTHTIQQGSQNQGFREDLKVSNSQDATEQEAAKTASAVVEDQPIAVTTQETGKIARQELDDEEPQEEDDQTDTTDEEETDDDEEEADQTDIIDEEEDTDSEGSETDIEQISLMSGILAVPIRSLKKVAKASKKKAQGGKKTTPSGKKGAPPAKPPKIVIDQPTANTVFKIDATPQMPTITCQARIVNVSPDPTPTTRFNWQISITEAIQRKSCASSRIGNCNVNAHGQGSRWTPTLNQIQGGSARIMVSATVGRSTLQASVSVKIRGTNPTAAAITSACGGSGTDADQIACKESTRRQFDTSDLPLEGSGGDVGVMQLCNPAANCLERWDWSANVRAGIALLRQKAAAARGHLNTHQVNGHFPNNRGLGDSEVLQRETLQRYNSGSYWTWNAASNQWEPRPSNGYADRALACH